MTEIEYKKAMLEAAQLRTRAAHQRDNAMSHRRQAKREAYEGQAEICLSKATKIEALAAENEAKADLIEAEANEAYNQ